jgi:hypothetical protein
MKGYELNQIKSEPINFDSHQNPKCFSHKYFSAFFFNIGGNFICEFTAL